MRMGEGLPTPWVLNWRSMGWLWVVGGRQSLCWWPRIPSITQIASGRVMVVVGREGLPLAIRARGWEWARIPSITRIASGRVMVVDQCLVGKVSHSRFERGGGGGRESPPSLELGVGE